jgi:hypothetical protein
MKNILTVVAIIAMSIASQALAADIIVTNVSIQNPYVTVIDGRESVYSGLVGFKTNVGDLYGFCVDIAHNINLGNVNLPYDYGRFNHDFNGNPVSLSTARKVFGLINIGNKDTTSFVDKSAIQNTIWKLVFPTQTFTSTNVAVNSRYTYYTNLAPSLNSNGYTLNSLNGKQSFAYSTPSVPGVPEPASWALMVIGFGIVGYASRSRNKVLTA